MPRRFYTLMEEGEQMDLTPGQLGMLIAANLIYECDDHDGASFYHIMPERTWDDVDRALDLT